MPETTDDPRHKTACWRRLWEWLTGQDVIREYEAAKREAARRAEVASLRLTLGGRTFGPDIPEPIGCPCPGACAQVAEIGRLRTIIRVNALRWNPAATHTEIDEVIYGKR
jgi:hypothetical protein